MIIKRKIYSEEDSQGSNPIGTAALIGGTAIGAGIGANMGGNRSLSNYMGGVVDKGVSRMNKGASLEMGARNTEMAKNLKTDFSNSMKKVDFGKKWNFADTMTNKVGVNNMTKMDKAVVKNAQTNFRAGAIKGGLAGAGLALGTGLMVNSMFGNKKKES